MITKTRLMPTRLMSCIKLTIIVCCVLGQALQLHAYDPLRNVTEYPNLKLMYVYSNDSHDIKHAEFVMPADGASISGELRIPGIVRIDNPDDDRYWMPCTILHASGFRKCTDITAVIFESQEIYWNTGYNIDYYKQIAEMYEDSAFYALPNLKYAVIQSVSHHAFANCPNLERVTLIDYGSDADDRLTFDVGTKSFANCPKLTTLECVGVLNALDSAFINCTALNLDGVIIKETSISSFENCTSLTNLTLQNFVVPRRAFYGCSGLKSIAVVEDTRERGVEFVEEYAFAGCDALTEVRCRRMEPPIAYDNSFSTYTATLHVPRGTLEKYKSASGWRNFTNIVDDLEPISGVASPDVYGITVKSAGNKVIISGNDSDEAVSIYDANGRRIYYGHDNEIQMPTPGMYIVKISGTVQKVMIK